MYEDLVSIFKIVEIEKMDKVKEIQRNNADLKDERKLKTPKRIKWLLKRKEKIQNTFKTFAWRSNIISNKDYITMIYSKRL